jgi:MFS family permease
MHAVAASAKAAAPSRSGRVCAFLIDGAATNWIAVQLRTDHEAPPGLAAAGYLVFTAALVVTRLVADRLSDRYPRTGIVRACGLSTAAGVAVAVVAPSAWVALGGWALGGLAVVLLAPTVLDAAPDATRPRGHHEDDTGHGNPAFSRRWPSPPQ